MVAEQGQSTPEPEGRISFHNKALQAGFTQIPRSLVHVPGLSHGAKLTWIALAEYAWSETPVFPGRDVLAKTLERDERVVARYVQELVRKNLLESRRRGMGQTNEYILYCSEDRDAAPPAERPKRTPKTGRIRLVRHDAGVISDKTRTSPHDRTPASHPIKEETYSEETYSLGTTPHGVGADAPPPAQKQRRATSKEKPAGTATTGADLLIDELREALGCATIGNKTREKWAAALRATLSECSSAERSRFVRWLVSSGYWGKETVFRLSGQLEAEAEAWLMAGKPERKPAAQSTSRGNGTMPAPLPDPDAPPRWIKEDPRIIDRDLDRNNGRFIAYWGNPPFLMSDDERAAAGVTAW